VREIRELSELSGVLQEQYARLLDSLPVADPWPALEASGFLDLLRDEANGGAGLPLEELFPLALETGRRMASPPVLEAMAERLGMLNRPLAAVLAAGQMAGAMSEVQALTVEYALTRKQFGREIGRFQAVQHQIAVMTEETIASRMAAQAAFVGHPLEVSEQRAAAAKIRCGQAAERVCAIAHAVYGAIGVSEEHVLHRYTRRLRAWRFAHGGECWWAQRLGDWAFAQQRDFTALARSISFLEE
jgi:acyl-CoA dehydrogenase